MLLLNVTAAAMIILILAVRMTYLDDRSRLLQARAARQTRIDEGEPHAEEGAWRKWKGLVTNLKVAAMGEDILDIETEMTDSADDAV